MKRRDFLTQGSLTALGMSFLPSSVKALSKKSNSISSTESKHYANAKNIIFMVSDGMSSGTLAMSNLLSKHKLGKSSTWMRLYEERKVTHGLMDTSSFDSWVTDSAASSSAWGGGKKVPNGMLNYNADGSENKPILQKIKEAGRAVGCITSVPVTHATPAGFCVSAKSRNQEKIANQYLDLNFDLFLGGGRQYFDSSKRKDGENLIKKFREKGSQVVIHKNELSAISYDKPILGLFADDALPYAIDLASDSILQQSTPTLAEMTQKGLEVLSKNKNGFVMQVEGGKVDWAAHANDISGLIYDQIAFEDAVQVAIEFAEKNKDTLVIITTDHGNANPGFFKTKKNNEKFERLFHFRHSNDWILTNILPNESSEKIIEKIEYATGGIVISEEEARNVLSAYDSMESEIYNYRQLPFKYFGEVMSGHTSTGFGSMDHSADYVEIAMFGPGNEWLPSYVVNTDLHNFMLEVIGL